MRARPVAVGQMPKVVPAGGDTVDGKFIPAGTAVGMNISTLLQSKVLFGADANIFRPERFLEADQSARAEMQRNVELIFGTGRWACAGKPLAFMELGKVFFEVSLPELSIIQINILLTQFQLLCAFDFQIVNPQNPMISSSAVLFIDKSFYLKVMETSG